VGLSVEADLDVLSVVGMHELDATNPLLLALIRVGHKGASLQCTTVDPHKSECTLHAQYKLRPHGVSSPGMLLKVSHGNKKMHHTHIVMVMCCWTTLTQQMG